MATIPRKTTEVLDRLRIVLQCPICHNLLNDPHSLPCQHHFCGECSERAIQDTNQCPECHLHTWVMDRRRNIPLRNLVASIRELDACLVDAIRPQEEEEDSKSEQVEQVEQVEQAEQASASASASAPVNASTRDHIDHMVDNDGDDMSSISNSSEDDVTKPEQQDAKPDTDMLSAAATTPASASASAASSSSSSTSQTPTSAIRQSKSRRTVSALTMASTTTSGSTTIPSQATSLDLGDAVPTGARISSSALRGLGVISPSEANDGSRKRKRPEKQYATQESSCSAAPLPDTKLKNVRRSKCKHFVLVTTGLSRKKQNRLSRVSELLPNVSINRQFSSKVTHIVTCIARKHSYLEDAPDDLRNQGLTLRTLKYMFGVLKGCWIVSYQWIEACIEANCWVDERDFEILGDTSHGYHLTPSRSRGRLQHRGLLHGYAIHVFRQLGKSDPNRNDLQALVTYGGGETIEELPMASVPLDELQKIWQHTPDEMDLTGSHSQGNSQSRRRSRSRAAAAANKVPKKLVLCSPSTTVEDARAIILQSGVIPVSFVWVMDCVSMYELLPIREYRLDIVKNLHSVDNTQASLT
jgi:Zinc finger, C3HC4 type (RING finger)